MQNEKFKSLWLTPSYQHVWFYIVFLLKPSPLCNASSISLHHYTTICHLLQSKYLRALTCCCPPSLMLASRLKQQQTPINPMSYIICHVFQKGHSNSESAGPVSTWVCFQVEFEFVDLYTPYFELIGSHITSLIFGQTNNSLEVVFSLPKNAALDL